MGALAASTSTKRRMTGAAVFAAILSGTAACSAQAPTVPDQTIVVTTTIKGNAPLTPGRIKPLRDYPDIQSCRSWYLSYHGARWSFTTVTHLRVAASKAGALLTALRQQPATSTALVTLAQYDSAPTSLGQTVHATAGC